MADVASTLNAWSTTESSNAPAGTTTIGAGLDENLRMIQAVVRQSNDTGTIASAGTTDLSTVANKYITVSGTTTITALGTLTAGMTKWLIFSGALTLTHNGTSLILPGAANITTVAGDTALMESLGSGNWRCLSYNATTWTGTGSEVHSASPTLSGTIGGALTWSGAQILTAAIPQLTLGVLNTTSGGILMYGSTSGSLTLKPAAAAGAGITITLPATSVTLNAAGDLSGNTLAAGVTASSLTSLGTIAALVAGTVSATGVISSTVNGTVQAAIQIVPATGTSSGYYKVTNTGGTLFFGVDGSTGAEFSKGNYATVISRPAATVFDINRAGTTDLSISATGAVTIPGTLGVTGAVTVGAGGINLTSATGTSYVTDSYTGTLTGCTTSPTGTVFYVKVGNLVTLYLPTIVGTSNTTAATITGAPAAIQPSVLRYMIGKVKDNSAYALSTIIMGTDGTITLFPTIGEGAFTASGEKGHAQMSVTYQL